MKFIVVVDNLAERDKIEAELKEMKVSTFKDTFYYNFNTVFYLKLNFLELKYLFSFTREGYAKVYMYSETHDKLYSVHRGDEPLIFARYDVSYYTYHLEGEVVNLINATNKSVLIEEKNISSLKALDLIKTSKDYKALIRYLSVVKTKKSHPSRDEMLLRNIVSRKVV